ncbi:MAG TPA: hypothetical protein VG406_17825, partial [Isosphaeraceae bacterium]|nr:hypothetical protein [Isosphaeraceae bacterium]
RETNPAAAGQILDGLDALENQGALKWLDRDKPVSATADLVPQAPGGPPSVPAVTVYLPVTGRDAFLDALKGLGLTVDDRPGAEGFSHKVVAQGGAGQAFYLLADPPAGYVVATTVASGADRLRAVKPADLKPTRPGTVLVGVRIDQVPDQLKAAFLNNVMQRNNASRQRKDGETDAQYQGRLAGIKFTEDAFKSLLRDGREMTLDADVAAKADRLTLALAVDAKPGTPLADSLSTFGARRGRFLNLWGDAAVTLQGVLPVPEALRAQIRSTIEQARAKAEKEDAPEDRRLSELMIDALTPTLTADAYDACLAMGTEKGGGKGEANVVLFGVGMKDSIKVEAALREAIARKLKPEDRDKVALDLDRGPDGTKIHRVTLDAKNLKAEEFGAPLMFLAFPDGAALAAVGGNGLAVLKRALGALKKAPASGAAPGPQVGFDFSAVRFSRIHSAENGNPFREAARDAFPGADSDPSKTRDRIKVGLTGASSRARLVIEADLPALGFLVKANVIQQKAKAAKAP